VGIPREILPKIFDSFLTTKDKKGTGLGLSVVYGIVKQIGGTVDVKSEPRAGTEFVLSLPASHELRRRAEHQCTQPVRGAEKILIADDEPEILKLLETVLKDLGYSVISAANGIEAVDYAADDIRLIFLDMIMPEMDGVAALRAIRQKLPDVKVLVSSGYTSPDKAPILESLGIHGFIEKPFEVSKLAGIVRDVLDGVTA
jgi:CheY-like chemotaxis protein